MIPASVKELLIADLNDRINTNGDREITGAILNDFLADLIEAIVPTIEESEDQPSVAGDLKIWRDGDNVVRIRDKSQVSTPFVPILVRLAEDVNPALALDILTNVLNFVPGELDLRLLKDFAGIDIGDLPDGGAIVWDADNSKFIVTVDGGGSGSPDFEIDLGEGVVVNGVGNSSGWTMVRIPGMVTITPPPNTKLKGVCVTGFEEDAVYSEEDFNNGFVIRLVTGSATVNQSFVTSYLRKAFVIDGTNYEAISPALPLRYDSGLVECSVIEQSGGTVSYAFNNLDNFAGGWLVGL